MAFSPLFQVQRIRMESRLGNIDQAVLFCLEFLVVLPSSETGSIPKSSLEQFPVETFKVHLQALAGIIVFIGHLDNAASPWRRQILEHSQEILKGGKIFHALLVSLYLPKIFADE